MTTKRNILTTILAAALLVSMTGTAFAAYDVIVPDPFNQTIGVGTIGVYTLTLYTDVPGEHTIMFDTNETLLHANLTGPNGGDADGQEYTTPMGTTGTITWNATSSQNIYTFTHEVWPQSTIPCGDYPLHITDTGPEIAGTVRVIATATPSASVVPELAAFALAGIGAVVGLLALGRRKD